VKKSNQGDFLIERRPRRISIQESQSCKTTFNKRIWDNSTHLTHATVDEKTPKTGFFSSMSPWFDFFTASIMEHGWQEWDAAITAAARHLGFLRTGVNIRAAFKSAINRRRPSLVLGQIVGVEHQHHGTSASARPPLTRLPDPMKVAKSTAR
jgi:hypothetical protein